MRPRAQKRMRTLVVDDSEIAVQTICSFLEGQAYIQIVGTARNGREALAQVEELRPDLVLMDMEMPEMSGLEALQYLHRVFPKTKVLVVTVHDNEEVRLACRVSGAYGFLAKGRLHREFGPALRQAFSELRFETKEGAQRKKACNMEEADFITRWPLFSPNR